MSATKKKIYTNRDFMFLWSGNATSVVGFYGVRIAYPLLVLTVTGSPALAGWVGFSIALPSLLFQIPAGIAADYWNRRRTLLLCQTAGLLATSLAAAMIFFKVSDLWLILNATAFVEGSANVFFNLSELGAVRDVVSVEQRPAAFSFFEAEQPIAILMGRAIGATIYGVARWLPFIANAASYVCCIGTLSAMRSDFSARRDERPPAPTGRREWSDVWEGVRIVWNQPFLRASTAITGATNMIIQAIILLIILELEEGGRPSWTVGVVLAAAGAGGLGGSFAASPLIRRYTAPAVYAGALWVWAALLLPIALSSDPFVLAIAWCCSGAVGTVVAVALTTYRVATIPEAALGQAVGAASIVIDGAVALGALLAGYLLSLCGPSTTGWILFAAMLTVAVIGTLLGLLGRPSPTLAQREQFGRVEMTENPQ
jgi:MFS family permease